MENEELIRRNMEQTRESLTEKLETLENKVMNSVQQATNAVTDTVSNVRESVADTVSSVKESMHDGMESVKDAVDVQAHVQKRPWLMLGGSVLCGYVLGNLLGGEKAAPAPTPLPAPARSDQLSNGNGRNQKREKATAFPPAPAAATPSWLDAIAPELQHLKGLALGVALGTAREMLTSEVPPHMADQLRNIIDGITEKLGGDLIPSSDWDALKTDACDSGATSGEFDKAKARW